MHFCGDEAHQRRIAPHHVIRGIALVPEGRGIFTRLTVEEKPAHGRLLSRDDKSRHRDRSAMVFDCFPASKGTRANRSRRALRRRAADAGHRPRPDEPAENAAARRAVDGPGADHGAEDFRGRRAVAATEA